MPAWTPSGSSGGSGGGSVEFRSSGNPSGGTPVYQPTASGGGSGVAGGQANPEAGVVSIDPTDPAGSAKKAEQNIGDMLAGLRDGIFGVDRVDGTHAGGVPIVGDIAGAIGRTPILGSAVGMAGNALGGGGELLGHTIDAAGGALERIPDPLAGVAGGHFDLDKKFNDSQVQQWLDEKNAEDPEKTNREVYATEGQNFDKGIGGTGFLGNEDHMKNTVLRAYAKAQLVKNPTLNAGAFETPGSLADTVTLVLSDTFGAANQGWQRLLLEAKGEGDELAIGRGEAVSTGFLGTGFMAGSKNATPAEQLAAQKFDSGEWTADQVKDFLVATGNAAHDPALNIALAIADPTVAASFGAGAIAKLGVKGIALGRAVEEADAIANTARASLEAAQLAADAAKGARAIKKATTALEAAKTGLQEAEAARAALTASKVARTTLAVGERYGGLEGTTLGRVAKATRTIIDPLHAIDLHLPGNARMVDLMSDATTKQLSATLGAKHYLGNIEHFRSLDETGAILDKYARDLATAATNRAREGILSIHQAQSILKGTAAKLRGAEPGLRDEIIDNAATATREKDLLKFLRRDYTANVLQHDWNEAAHADLAAGLEARYGIPKEEWLKVLPGMSKEQKSLMKFAVYGGSNSRLLGAISATKAATHASMGKWDPDKFILIAKTTLTRVGGDSLLSSLKAIKGKNSTRQAVALIRDWQERYPQLRYITIDSANPGKSVKQFITYLEDNLDALPMQFTRDELKQMHPSMQDLGENLADGYQLGMRPKDEFLWGLERANKAGGEYIAKHVPWADHVGEGGLGYRPSRLHDLNIAGHIIPGTGKVGKAIDHIEAGARTLGAQVSSEQVAIVARQRFTSEASRGRFAEHGLTEGVAGQWFDRIMDYTRERKGYSGPRGLSKGDLYNALYHENLIPQTILNGSMRFQPEDALHMVLDAFDGDMRYIGLTQKLSGRAKKALSFGDRINYAGQIAEHVWPTVKFAMNPIFQAQEIVEPLVLNVQRGIAFAKSPTMNAADTATENLLQRMASQSLIRHGDLDNFEQSMYALMNKRVANLSRVPGGRMSKLTDAMAKSLPDVQGIKRVNMVRTFRKGLGKELKSVWDETAPGTWDQMLAHARAKTGRFIDEDEFAVQMFNENLFANDLPAKAGDITKALDWSNAIKPGEWYRPTHLGEVKGLDLDHVAGAINLSHNGKRIDDLASLRQYIGEDNSRIENVTEFLNRMGADPDYVARVENALTFSWEGFWKTAADRFSLTNTESIALQDMIAEAAHMRGLAPADFLSQVYHPGILDGTEGILGSLENPLGVLRRTKSGAIKGSGRSRLAGKAGESTRDDLVRQLSGVFSSHLDPSAKRALLMEFKPELRKAVLKGDVRLDLKDLQTMWDADAEGQLADRILGYMDGKPGTGVFDVIDDEARGIKAIREGADKYLERNGVTPLTERRHYQVDEAHYQKAADEYSALPEVEYEKTGRRPMTKQVYAADTDLKPKPDGVDDRTYEAYQQFVIETKAQFEHMTMPKAKGGMGIKVTVAKGDPYTADAAGRAAMAKDLQKGELRVLGLNSDHPLMTNEQNVMFRAVHDVFGHSGEGFEFGPRGELNAAASHFKMYSADARGPLLTETHGQTAYVNFSNDVYVPKVTAPKPLNPASPAEDFESRYPFAMPKRQRDFAAANDMPLSEAEVRLRGDNGNTLDYAYSQRVGDGIRILPPDQQAAILQPLADLFDEFPELKVFHIDAIDFRAPLDAVDVDGITGLGTNTGAFAITFGADEGEAVIMFDRAHIPELQKGGYAQHNELMKDYDTFYKPDATGKMVDRPRETAFGTPHNAGTLDVAQVARHEAGHAFDVSRRPQKYMGTDKLGAKRYAQVSAPGYEDYHAMMVRMEKEAGRLHLSEYGMKSGPEFAAELFSFATNPDLDLAAIKVPELRSMVEEFQTYLRQSGEWVPSAKVAPEEAALAGKRIRDINAAKRGTVYAPQKAGLLPQSTIDEFAQQFVGVGKHVESNPDVARTAQQFSKWSQAAVFNGLMKGERAVHADLLNDIAKVPTHSASAYNYTEGITHQLGLQAMQRKFDDAFRLQYFSQDRTMLERSINHPMFGMYPASYMWGKLMPEVVQFIAQRPFGIRTGGALSGIMHAKASIALRREYDPEFDAKMEELGHSQAMGFLGYLLPTVPWDISASAPAWMKAVAEQGNANARAAAKGQDIKDFNAVQPLVNTIKKLNPLETTVPWGGRALDEVFHTDTPAEARKKLVDQNKAVKASELQPTIEAIYAELRAALSK